MASAMGERATSDDRRVRRTRRALAEALIALTQERPYEAVTIRDLAARAGIGYATFFRHYPDKDALLGDTLEVAIDAVVALLTPALTDDDPAAIGTALFRYARDNAALVRVLLGGRATALVLARFGAHGGADDPPAPPAPPGIPAEIAAHHRATASLALLQWWLDAGMPYPPEQMGAIYRDLVLRPTIAGG